MPSFAQVPTTNPSPGAYVEVTSAGSGAIAPRRALIIAFTHGANPGPVLEAKEIVGDAHPWPRDTQIAKMIAAYRRKDPLSPITAIAMDDGAGSASSATLVFTGPATADGSLAVRVDGKLITVAVADGDDATTIGDAVAAAINADPDVGFSAANVTGTVTLTSLLEAAEADNSTLAVSNKRGEELPDGVGVTVGAFAGGSGVVDVTTAFALVGSERYFALVQGMTDATAAAALAAEVDRRWGATIEHHGQGFIGINGTVAEQITEGQAINAKELTVMGAGKSLSPRWEWAAEAAGADARKTFLPGGYLGTAMPGLDAPEVSDRYEKDERDALLNAGVSTYRVGGTGVVLDRLVTNKSKDLDGNPDTSELALTARRATEYLAFNWRSLTYNKFVSKGFALADAPDVIPSAGSKILTPSVLKAEAVSWFVEQRQAGLVQDLEKFKESLDAAINGADDNRIDTFLRPRLTKELVTIATLMETV